MFLWLFVFNLFTAQLSLKAALWSVHCTLYVVCCAPGDHPKKGALRPHHCDDDDDDDDGDDDDDDDDDDDVDRFYIALFSALEQTHCARM